jgi:UDP-2,4-diacetamido-2,4,6-trideoxy-beta-L-altropyranose hydrolase
MREASAVSLRRATAADARRLWELRNEETVRRVSFSAEPIAFDRHERWLAARLTDETAPIYMIAAEGGADVGYVRFDAAAGEALVSVALAPEARGHGLGPAALRAAVAAFRAAGRRAPVVALVRADNPRSRTAFERAGFVAAGERRVGGATATAMAWRDG